MQKAETRKHLQQVVDYVAGRDGTLPQWDEAVEGVQQQRQQKHGRQLTPMAVRSGGQTTLKTTRNADGQTTLGLQRTDSVQQHHHFEQMQQPRQLFNRRTPQKVMNPAQHYQQHSSVRPHQFTSQLQHGQEYTLPPSAPHAVRVNPYGSPPPPPGVSPEYPPPPRGTG